MDRKWIPLWVMALCLSTSLAWADAAPPEAATSLPDLVKRCGPAVVVVEAQVPEGLSQGSGVIVDPSGKVLTCYHVVKEAKSVLVKTWNGGYFPVEGMLGMNPKADFAVLRLRAKELPSVPIGDYTRLLPGESVFVISSPDGLQNTVSEGVVSGLRKVGDLPDDYRPALRAQGLSDAQELVQFSAPTYYGSSGGPLFNGRGEVIGIVALRHPADAVYFAIPAKLTEPHLASESVIRFGGDASGDGKKVELIDPRFGDLPASVGLSEPVTTTVAYAVPETGESAISLPTAASIDPDTIKVRDAKTGEALTRTTKKPWPGEFRPLHGGVIYFHPADGGRRVEITYTYATQRVAVLPGTNFSGYPELADVVREAACQEFEIRQYQVVPPLETQAAMRAAKLSPSSAVFGDTSAFEPASIRQVAADTDSALVVFSAVDLVPPELKPTIAVSIAVFDGRTGKSVYAKSFGDRREISVLARRSSREDAVREFVAQLLREYLGPGPGETKR